MLDRGELREETRLEIEYLAKTYPDTYIREEFVKGEDYYIDQAPRNGVCVNSFYTESGLRDMDGWYGYQIRKGHPGYSVDEMIKLIKHNPHLHNVIKTNLLENLQNRLV